MTRSIKLLIVILSVYFALMAFYAVPALSSPLSKVTTTEEQPQPEPGIIMIITFENGTTKAIRSDSTDIRAVQGGYFVADPSVQAAKPLQSKTISKTVVQQLVSIFVDVRVIDDPIPIPIPIRDGACAALYTYNPETGQCELPPSPSPSPVVECEPGYMLSGGECVIDPMPRTINPPPPVEEEGTEPEPSPEQNEDEGQEEDTPPENNEESNGEGDEGNNGSGGDEGEGNGAGGDEGEEV
jgi:hypothetical protein